MRNAATRGAAIADYCRQCIGDDYASGTWREQTGCCGSTACPLWRFRPLPRNAPPWIASREPADLPDGWAKLDHDAAIGRLRGNIDANADGAPARAHGERDTIDPPSPMRPARHVPESPQNARTREAAADHGR